MFGLVYKYWCIIIWLNKNNIIDLSYVGHHNQTTWPSHINPLVWSFIYSFFYFIFIFIFDAVSERFDWICFNYFSAASLLFYYLLWSPHSCQPTNFSQPPTPPINYISSLSTLLCCPFFIANLLICAIKHLMTINANLSIGSRFNSCILFSYTPT